MTIDDEDRGYGEEGLTPEEQDPAAEGGEARSRDPDPPSTPSSTRVQDELVDRASEDSFPASDPPAYWQRPASDHSEVNERSDLPASDGEPDTASSDREHPREIET
jgi:hypothetical protein